MNALRPVQAGAKTYNGRTISAAAAAEYARLTELAELARRTGLKATRDRLLKRRAAILRGLP
jgi:hypothetical protein